MKRLCLIAILMAALMGQGLVMAKGQWIYGYNHPPVAAEVNQTDC